MTIYRKYRPKYFSELVGREAISIVLKNEIKDGNIANAYLFSGTRGTGKTSMARIFAKALNCEKFDKKKGEPCGKCSSCLAINEGTSTDLIEIDAASNRGIDEIRQLKEHVRYVPTASKYKVYVIDEAHMLTKEAFNALLKTLEEPPSHVVFVLATTELNKIMGTIFSRCQHFNFSKLSAKDISLRISQICKMEGVDMDDSVALEIARRSGGSLRDAESLLGQMISIGSKKITQKEAELFLPKVGFSKIADWVGMLASKDAKSAFSALSDIENEGVNLSFFLEEVIEFSRRIMIYLATGQEKDLENYFSKDEILEIRKITEKISTEDARLMVVEFLKASWDMKYCSDMPSLPIEIAVVFLCSQKDSDSNSKIKQTENNSGDVYKTKNSDDNLKTEKIEPKFQKQSLQKEETEKKESIKNTNQNKEENNEINQKDKNGFKEESVEVSQVHSLEQVLDGWGEVLAKVKDKNHALNFVLGVAKPTGVSGGKIELGFKYRLQQEKICEIKNKLFVEDVIKEVYGSEYSIEAVLKEDIEFKNSQKQEEDLSHNLTKESDEFIKTALEVFEGAEIVG